MHIPHLHKSNAEVVAWGGEMIALVTIVCYQGFILKNINRYCQNFYEK